MKSEQMANTTSMIEILGILRKHMKMIIMTTLITVFATGFVTFFVLNPKYESTTEILVNRKMSDELQAAQFQQVQADVQMISTYKDIITSPTVLDDVNQEVQNYPGYPGSELALQKSISISNQQNSQVFSVTAKATDPNTAAAIANMTADVFKKKVGKIMSINNVSIVSKASPSRTPYSPRKTLSLIGGLIVGLILGIALALIREATDKTVINESFLTEDMGWVNLGQINEISKKSFEEVSGIGSTSGVRSSNPSDRRV
ncbi:YveK family protein [Companilactobacillus nodensis]|uniref:Capsular polysaccharide biosynthesis protein CpsC n=1 Tax=Companilactobacillus nodensis DSM 19682 = JCM 14932 = NBRC 107160 TaxID=1423775 RepID=A0A0R1K6J2_9LACO|nr:Wzz/FepE/Etk N-terminal domain-containing protein [Companilactobacillus nodensis]KRK79036.1 capsular polysaccharide biosynthesis protein [Companilactobacillus nodensis DSM 19682 = JCM 14932 = NBRC 107160]